MRHLANDEIGRYGVTKDLLYTVLLKLQLLLIDFAEHSL